MKQAMGIEPYSQLLLMTAISVFMCCRTNFKAWWSVAAVPFNEIRQLLEQLPHSA